MLTMQPRRSKLMQMNNVNLRAAPVTRGRQRSCFSRLPGDCGKTTQHTCVVWSRRRSSPAAQARGGKWHIRAMRRRIEVDHVDAEAGRDVMPRRGVNNTDRDVIVRRVTDREVVARREYVERCAPPFLISRRPSPRWSSWDVRRNKFMHRRADVAGN